MKDHNLGFYLDRNSTLTPEADALRDVQTSAWWKAVEPFFDDIIWQYFSEREVFCTDKFDPRDPDETTKNILRAFAINLKTREYTYSKLYETTILEYNPLYNVDAYEQENRTLDQTGTAENKKTGKDTNTKTGSEKDTKTGREANTRTGSELDSPSGQNVTTKAATTFDSSTMYDTEKSTDVPGVINSHQYNQVKDETSFTNREDTHSYNNVKDETNYNSADLETRDLKDTEEIIKRRFGNIGITKSTELIADQRRVVEFDFCKRVVKDCVNCVSYALY